MAIFCRFEDGNGARWGVVSHHAVAPISSDPFCDYTVGEDTIPFNEVEFLAPVEPSKIIAVGLNYKKHAQEMNHALPSEPILFMKPPTSIIGNHQPIIIPRQSAQTDYEGELAVVIKKMAHQITPQEAPEHILGYTCFNDVTARDLQRKDGQWTRAKSFNTFSPVGPWIVEDLDPTQALLETYVNGELRQSGSTADMIFPVFDLVSFISGVMTLLPGDLITTGTPAGIGPLKANDFVDVRIEGIGVLRNPVIQEQAR